MHNPKTTSTDDGNRIFRGLLRMLMRSVRGWYRMNVKKMGRVRIQLVSVVV